MWEGILCESVESPRTGSPQNGESPHNPAEYFGDSYDAVFAKQVGERAVLKLLIFWVKHSFSPLLYQEPVEFRR